MRPLHVILVTSLAVGLGAPAAAQAGEYPIGEPEVVSGLEVAAVYLQPIEMAPPGMMRAVAGSDIHLEADIHAAAGNRNGFAEGDWVPHLVVRYELAPLDGGAPISGVLMPMVASDGPHYGDNVALPGPGRYGLRLSVLPPGADGTAALGRHIDRETGVAPWFEPFTVDLELLYAGTGKKGSY